MVGLSKIFVDWFKGKSSPETMGFPKKVPLDFSRQLQRFNQKPVVISMEFHQPRMEIDGWFVMALLQVNPTGNSWSIYRS